MLRLISIVEALPDEEAGPWEDIEELSSTKNVTGEEAVHRTQTRMISMLKTQSRWVPLIHRCLTIAEDYPDALKFRLRCWSSHRFLRWWLRIYYC